MQRALGLKSSGLERNLSCQVFRVFENGNLLSLKTTYLEKLTESGQLLISVGGPWQSITYTIHCLFFKGTCVPFLARCLHCHDNPYLMWFFCCRQKDQVTPNHYAPYVLGPFLRSASKSVGTPSALFVLKSGRRSKYLVPSVGMSQTWCASLDCFLQIFRYIILIILCN